jgi:hypothetical protein
MFGSKPGCKGKSKQKLSKKIIPFFLPFPSLPLTSTPISYAHEVIDKVVLDLVIWGKKCRLKSVKGFWKKNILSA